MSNDCCFRRATQGQLSQYNGRNIAAALRAVVKYNKGLKEAKMFACGFSQNL